MTTDSENAESPIITNHEHLRMRAREYLAEVNKYIFPLYSEDKHKKLTLWGSGVAVQNDGHYFLATAKHVVSEIHNIGSDVLVASGNITSSGTVFAPLGSTRNRWKFHSNHLLDLAVLPLSDPLPGLDFFPVGQHTHGHLPAMKGHYFMAGYPSSRNKLVKVNASNDLKQAFIASIIVKIDQSLDFVNEGKNTKDFLGFKYRSIYEDGEFKRDGIALNGMSGCGLWYFPTEGTDKYFLAGIFIEHWARSHNGYATLAKFLKDIT